MKHITIIAFFGNIGGNKFVKISSDFSLITNISYNNNNNRRSNLRRNNSQLRGNHNVKYNNPYNGRRQMNNNNNRNFIRASRY